MTTENNTKTLVQVGRWLAVVPVAVLLLIPGTFLVHYIVGAMANTANALSFGDSVFFTNLLRIVIAYGGHGFVTVYLPTLIAPSKKLGTGLVLALAVSASVIIGLVVMWNPTYSVLWSIVHVVLFCAGAVSGAFAASDD